MIDLQKARLLRFNLVLLMLLGFVGHGGTAHGQGLVTVPTFFTTMQYQTFQDRSELEPGSLASCTVPNVTINHSPGYVVPTTPPQTIFTNLAATPHATCNDGTPAVFLFRPGHGAAASRWVIYLDGGGECDSEAACIEREREVHLISSQPYLTGGQTLPPLSGILSPNPAQNPDFYDANLVQISYCSSDYWMGEQEGNAAMSAKQIRASNNVANWYFNGHGIVQGVIQLLQTSYGLNNASDVLLAGGSAGAVGVFMNASYVAGLLPLHTRFAAVADSGFSPSSYPDYDPATGAEAAPPTNAQQVLTNGRSLWGAVGDFGCAYLSNQAGNGINNIACDYPNVLSQNATFRIPIFIRTSYHDNTILTSYNISQPVTSEEQPYVTNFDNAMEQALSSTNVWLTVFGLNTTNHTMIKTAAFTAEDYNFPDAESTTLAAAIGAWYRNPCSAPRLLQKPTQE